MTYIDEPMVLYINDLILYKYKGWTGVIESETGRFTRFNPDYREDAGGIADKLTPLLAEHLIMPEDVFNFFMMVQQMMEESHECQRKLGKPIRSAKSAANSRPT